MQRNLMARPGAWLPQGAAHGAPGRKVLLTQQVGGVCLQLLLMLRIVGLGQLVALQVECLVLSMRCRLSQALTNAVKVACWG
jgi:hypothetical protein